MITKIHIFGGITITGDRDSIVSAEIMGIRCFQDPVTKYWYPEARIIYMEESV